MFARAKSKMLERTRHLTIDRNNSKAHEKAFEVKDLLESAPAVLERDNLTSVRRSDTFSLTAVPPGLAVYAGHLTKRKESTLNMTSIWTPQLNAALGSLVVAVGAWLAWDSLSLLGTLAIVAGTAGFLLWRGRTIGLVWAWSSFFLGLESFAWPMTTMVRIRSATPEPSAEEMGMILSAVVMGLFSAVFWIAFSYGLFKRAGGEGTDVPPESSRKTQTGLGR